MEPKVFDKMHLKSKAAFSVGLAAKTLGEDSVRQSGKVAKPMIEDVLCHGFPGTRLHAPPAKDPVKNYWGGAWRVHELS